MRLDLQFAKPIGTTFLDTRGRAMQALACRILAAGKSVQTM